MPAVVLLLTLLVLTPHTHTHPLQTTREPAPNSPFSASVGNGFVATPVLSDTVFVSGVFSGLNSKAPSHGARFPSPVAVLATNASLVSATLDIATGTYIRTLKAACGATLTVRMYAHRAIRNLLVTHLSASATSSSPCAIPLAVNSGAPSPDLFLAPLANVSTPSVAVSSGSTRVAEEPGEPLTVVAVASSPVPPVWTIPPNSPPASLSIFGVFSSSLDSPNPSATVVAGFKLATQLASNGTLYPAHVAAWAELWDARITLAGGSSAAALGNVVNASLYYILSSLRADWPYTVTPGSLAGGGGGGYQMYNHHAFWDAETWMLPTVALMYPAEADAALAYRLNRLRGAREKAASYSPPYKGAMFPWESAASGEEVCPTTAATGKLEQHISGDIVMALRLVWALQANTTWLADVAWPIVAGVADFWASRVVLVDGLFHINGVIPPDEYAVNVNNSVYTNAVAKLSLEFAVNVSTLLGAPPPPAWAHIAANMYIPFDPVSQTHPEYDGYAGQTIKQADVVLLGYPLAFDQSPAVRANDLAYYAPRTDPAGPAMTWSMYCIGWLAAGNKTTADANFAAAYKPYVVPPFNVWSQNANATGGTNFITGAGGFLQSLWAGYASLRVADAKLDFPHPLLPPSVDELCFRGIAFHAARFNVCITPTNVTVALTHHSASASPSASAPPPRFALAHHSAPRPAPLLLGHPIAFPRSPFSITRRF